MTAIKSIETRFVRIPSRTAYQMGSMKSGASHTLSLFARLETDDGHVGWGECYVTPGWYGADTPASMDWLIRSVFAPKLKGISVFDIEAIERQMHEVWQLGNWYPKSVIEIAARDAAARSAGLPLHDMMGGAYRDEWAVSGGIGTETPEAMAASAAKFKSRGFQTVKLKICAVDDMDLDIARVREVRAAVGPEMNIRLDANGVYSVPQAIRLCRKIEQYDIESIEQPVQRHNIQGMSDIRQSIGIPLMADESVHDVHDTLRVIQQRAADVIKIKISKCGGLGPTRRIAELCQAADIEVTVGNGFNSSLLATTELQMTCTSSAITLAGEFIGPDKLEDDICTQPMQFENGKAKLPKGPGLGVEIDMEKLDKYTVSILESAQALS